MVELNNKERFALIIINIMRDNDLNIIEAITSYSEDNLIEMEDIIPLLDKSMKEKIRLAGIEGNYVIGQRKPVSLGV